MAARKTKPPGRKKGVPNKISGTAKENIVAVFTRLGGTDHMARWARRNQTDFYRLYARLIPTEVSGINGKPIAIESLPATPDSIGKYHERLAKIAADRALRRSAPTVARAGISEDLDGEGSGED